MKHTKGPWHIMEGGFSNQHGMIQVYATNDDLEMICQVYNDVNLCHSIQDYKANSKLISKSPEMLEALKGVIRLKELLLPPPNIPAVHEDEARAITTMINKIESIIKELE